MIGAGENDYDRDLRYTTTLFDLLTSDATHAAQNQQIMQEWLRKYVPLSINAARGLQPIWSQPLSKPVTFENSLERSKTHFRSIVEGLKLRIPEEVSA